MANIDWLAKDDEGKADQMIVTRDNLPGFLAQLGLLATNPLVVQFYADATYFRALLNLQKTFQQFGLALTDWKNYERDGGAVAVATPTLPVLPPGFPVAVAPGVIARYRYFANFLKMQPGYTHAIGLAIGIEGGHTAARDVTALQPTFTLKITGGHVFISWSWHGLSGVVSMIEFHVDRHDGKGRVFLANSAKPGYTDLTPFPTPAAVWTYDAIWVIGDAPVGQQSNPVSITVGG